MACINEFEGVFEVAVVPVKHRHFAARIDGARRTTCVHVGGVYALVVGDRDVHTSPRRTLHTISVCASSVGRVEVVEARFSVIAGVAQTVALIVVASFEVETVLPVNGWHVLYVLVVDFHRKFAILIYNNFVI